MAEEHVTGDRDEFLEVSGGTDKARLSGNIDNR